MDIKQYEKDHYDERLDDLNQWCDNGELYLKCKKDIVHKVPTKEAIWQISLFENELYKVDCIVDDYGHPHAYLTEFGDQICISLDDDDSDFELVVIEQTDNIEIPNTYSDASYVFKLAEGAMCDV